MFGASSLVSTVIYGISPLYTSNQNQYLLYGLARGGMGWLCDDWMANTTDPVPLFSWLVYLTYRFLSVDWFYVYFAAAVGIYIYALSRIVFILFDFSGSWLRRTANLSCEFSQRSMSSICSSCSMRSSRSG